MTGTPSALAPDLLTRWSEPPLHLDGEQRARWLRLRRRARIFMWIAVALIPLSCVAFFSDILLAMGLALGQLLFACLAIAAGTSAIRLGRTGGVETPDARTSRRVGLLAAIALVLEVTFGFMVLAASAVALGGAWGRPLRIRGQQRHPSLRAGSDWTAGERPSAAGLDLATRRALEALWLHDAQKEHASVPAFARISWLLAAVGAPAELMVWAHRAGLEEIEHTRQCFALAAGYGGRSHTVEPMPELLLGGLDLAGDPRAVLAVESLSDGCQLEDFNADVAAECARACEEPATRAVLERIAVEERSHAEFSWALVAFLLERDRAHVEAPLRRALAELAAYPRPTAVSGDKLALVAAADPAALRRHGRLPDERWAALWQARLAATTRRIEALLAGAPAAAA